jgi:hypothetical protein
MKIMRTVCNDKVYKGVYLLCFDKTYYWRRVWDVRHEGHPILYPKYSRGWGTWGDYRVEFKESDLDEHL